MAKSDAGIDEIDLSRAFSPPHTAKWAEGKAINAFDTETIDGDPFIVSVAWDNGKSRVYPTVGPRILDGEEIYDILTNRNARSALNVWYNLSFDADVVLSAMLDREQLGRLSLTGHVETERGSITYIPSKFLEIKHDSQTYTHYDIAQFFYTSLENAVNEWLPDTEKLTSLVDTRKFGSNACDNHKEVTDSCNDCWTRAQAWDYINENYDDIHQYADRDAIVTRDLWRKAIEMGEQMGVPMGRPYSTGYLAESYLNEHLGHKPGMGPKDMRNMAWDAYAGGRFEVIKRGDIGEVAGPDINSAYPWVLSHLPDPKTLTWENKRDASIDDIKRADYGFVRATVTTDPSRPIQPFAVKMSGDRQANGSNGKLKYPALTEHEVTCIAPIFELAHDYDYLLDYEIHDTWLATESMYADYPFQFIPGLYDTRKTHEDDGKYKLALWLKIVLNSMYGKTCQTTPKRREVEDTTIELDGYETFVSEMQLPPDMRDVYEGGIIERLEAGAWFNPFLASYITGMTRHELHKSVLEYGLEDNTVMLATDCLMVERDAFDNSGFINDKMPDESVPYRKQLGMWDYDYTGRAYVIGAGVYQIDFDTCKSTGCKHKNTDACPDDSHYRKVKTRGFNEADLEEGLRVASSNGNEHIDIFSTRPTTAKEAIWHNQSLSEVANFSKRDRKLFPDMDDKRVWHGMATFDNLLRETQDSQPLVLK